jgi:hypothetical protein
MTMILISCPSASSTASSSFVFQFLFVCAKARFLIKMMPFVIREHGINTFPNVFLFFVKVLVHRIATKGDTSLSHIGPFISLFSHSSGLLF